MNNNGHQNNINPGRNLIADLNNSSFIPNSNNCIIDSQNLNQHTNNNVTNKPKKTHYSYVEKYRVRDFKSMLGNQDAVDILLGEVIHNFYQNVKIFYGPPSSGKTSAAIIQAKLINCKSPKDIGVPCDSCISCTSFANNANPDIIRINAGSNNGVETAREIENKLKKPLLYNKKVVILEEWQKMTPNALTSLLDIMEAPSLSNNTARGSDYIFLMPTTELPSDISDNAVLSRAVIVKFYPIQKEQLLYRLNEICKLEGINVEDGVLDILYSNSNGAMRDCLKHLQTLATRSKFNITVDSINKFFSLAKSNLSKDLFDAIHSLNPTIVSTLIESHCNNTVLKEYDFNNLSELFVQASYNSTPFMHKMYTECLRILRDNRIAFLRDSSRKVQDNLIIACNEIISLLRDNLGLAISNQIKELDIDFGSLLLSLNPSIKISNKQIIFTIDPPNISIDNFLYNMNRPEIVSVFRVFKILNFEFNNIGRKVCYKIATEFNRDFGEELIRLNPNTQVCNNKLILTFNQPNSNLNDFMNKINSDQVISIFYSFGISKYSINNTDNIINPTANNSNNNQGNTLGVNLCQQIASRFNKNFGEFLISLKPTIFTDNENNRVLSIETPKFYSNGTPINLNHFNSYLCNPQLTCILVENGITKYQYR